MNPKREARRRWGAAAWLKKDPSRPKETRYQVGKVTELGGKRYVAVLGRGASWQEAFDAVDAKPARGVIASAEPRMRP